MVQWWLFGPVPYWYFLMAFFVITTGTVTDIKKVICIPTGTYIPVLYFKIGQQNYEYFFS